MKTGFLDKLIERMDRLDPESVQTHFLHLAQERGLMEAIFQSIQEGILVIDGQGRITYANRASERYLGFSFEQVKNRPIARVLRDIDWARILALDTVEWSRMSSYEIEVRYPEMRTLSFYVVPLAAVHSREKGAVVILRDVTRDRANNATILETERINAIQMLAAGVAHEIGNPLNAMNIHLQLLERQLARVEDPPQRAALMELLDIAKKEVSRLDLIITRFLRAIRPTKPHLAQAQLEVLIKETLAVMQQEFESRHIQVALECHETPPSMRLDKDQMKQAFFNVIKNALQAMSDGGALTISIDVSDRVVSIAFHDSGTGIDPADFGHVFEPYYTTKSSGTGLGLMIVQRIVQEHGGKIALRSAPQKGTTVTIQLPLDERRVRLLKPAGHPATASEEPMP